MSTNRFKLVAAGVFILVMITLLQFPSHTHQSAVLDQADRDVAAARAAADAAAVSAAKARDAARDLQNRLPGNS
jgi:hypothetical protein